MANTITSTQESVNQIEISEGQAVVVYDSRTGHICHIHEEITLPGGHRSDPNQLKERALKLARELAGQPLGDVKTLHARGSELRGNLRVDVAKQVLTVKKAA